jgi:DNA-3-methyladenine glycosylase
MFERPTLVVARNLLGCLLVHESPEGTVAGTIVEVEAYCGPQDRAAHSFGGRRTPRNEVMYGPPGHAYVYFTYGMHYCLNVVTRPEGIPQAVLLRAVDPVAGIDLMRRRRGLSDGQPIHCLCRGPGNLCRAFGIDLSLNGADLRSSRLRILPGPPVPRSRVGRSARIGVDYAGEWALRPWRFFVRDHPAVSRPRSGVPAPAARRR